MKRQQQHGKGISRRELADLFSIHQDSVSRLLADGLACAVLAWGGRGLPMRFDLALALRFWKAMKCLRDGGRPCEDCRGVLEDSKCVAEHLLEKRDHGHGGCRECRPPGRLCQPCSLGPAPKLRNANV